jgi:hypothetical protein
MAYLNHKVLQRRGSMVISIAMSEASMLLFITIILEASILLHLIALVK